MYKLQINYAALSAVRGVARHTVPLQGPGKAIDKTANSQSTRTRRPILGKAQKPLTVYRGKR